MILVTESWCNSDISDAYLSIDGYELQPDLRTDRSDTAQGRGGGLLVYAKNCVKILKLHQELELQQYCKFQISDVTVYLLYRSPNAPPAAMDVLAELVRVAPKNAIFIRDFNLPDIDWNAGTCSARSRAFWEAVQDSMMEQLVEFSTQVRGNCLDLVLTNIPERVASVVEAGRLGRSDHEMILITLDMERTSKCPEKIVYNWRLANWDGIRQRIAAMNWAQAMEGKTAHQMWGLLKLEVEAAVESNVPMKKVCSGGRPYWMTRKIMAAIRRKKRLWKKAKEGGDMEYYKEAEKCVKGMIRCAKRNFEKKLAKENGRNSKPFYSYVKKKTRSRPSIGPLRNEKNETVTDDQGMTEVLNRFFSSVFTKERTDKIPTAAEMRTEAMPDVGITDKIVRAKIRKLKPASATGPDGIGPKLLQELEYELTPVLAKIFRRSLQHGEVPDDWKSANVTPIFKKGSKADPGNYRPVSLTSVCCKMLESILRDSMMDHLTRNGLLNESQHGFMPGRSCCTNLLEFLETVTKVIDAGKPFDVVFLDFAKAFDKVPRERLLEKLRAHGIRGRTLLWIRTWLTGRRQRVVLNGKNSDWAEVLSGVPQGSVLGTILFLVYINDIDMVVTFIELLKKFADDTKLGQTAATAEDREKLQRALDKLCEWVELWGMEFNIKKCKVMHLGHNNTKQVYTMKGQQLEVTEEERDIGVTMSKNLKPSAQCAKAARTAQTVLAQISRAFHFRDRHIFVRLYVQYVRPHLEFAGPAWSPWLEADKEVLEKIQRRAVGMVSGNRADTYEERLRELGLTTLEERRHQADIIQTFKILHKKDSVRGETWFTMAK